MNRKRHYVVRVDGNIFKAHLTEQEATQIADKFRTDREDLTVSVEKNIFGADLFDIIFNIIWYCFWFGILWFYCRLLFF